MKRRSKIIITVLLLMSGLTGLNVFVPIYTNRDIGYNCRLCAATKSEETVHIWGLLVYKTVRDTERTAYTELYDRYIAESHKHQWAGGGWGGYSRYLFTGGIFKDGMHGNGYPLYQSRLTCDALSVMELFEDESVEFRREMYHDLIECKRDEYEKTRELMDAIRGDPENARMIYEMYMKQKIRSHAAQ